MEFSMSTVSLVHMSRKSIHISIPTPCHESWDGMDMTERGAFCHSCQKEVIDFSAMTDREVIEYLIKHQTGCGRFRKDQVDTKLTIPKVDNGAFRWRALFLSVLSLLSFKNIMAQTDNKTQTAQTTISKTEQKDSLLKTPPMSVDLPQVEIKAFVKPLIDSEDTFIGQAITIDTLALKKQGSIKREPRH